jgi:hypothetical protein
LEKSTALSALLSRANFLLYANIYYAENLSPAFRKTEVVSKCKGDIAA